jgi:hypothetical protein
MGAFFAGVLLAAVLATVASVGLNAWDLSSKSVFSTEETRL